MAYEMFKVLLVDDNQVTLTVYEKFLSLHHYQVIKAKDGTEALEKAFIEKPDIILLDIMMPGISGYEVCSRLREAPSTADIPIMILTAMNRSSARQKALDLGADDFINKTEDLDSIEGRIKMLLKQRILAHTRSWLADLAGSTAIEHTLRYHLQSGHKLAVIYMDLKDMEMLYEQEAYDQAEQILWQIANTLNDLVVQREKGEFIGYLGLDHFAILADYATAEKLAEEVIQRFEAIIHNLIDYPKERNQYPSLAFGIVIINNGKGTHPSLVSYTGQNLLQQARRLPGNTIKVTRLGTNLG